MRLIDRGDLVLSIILYGRNDSYGYNLHKRAALSLNTMASLLDDPDDEILFVDYNTPNELPTFPESIDDTLTDRCKERLRILRVRPEYHNRFDGLTSLAALECQSRNIAARRSNPRNRWLLSTNTDMIFCPTAGDHSLSATVGRLPDGFYHLPRFEVPEGFWERLPRQDPEQVIRSMRQNAKRFHLDEIVIGAHDNIYDGPGDFQLFLREDYFQVHGFDESMILGWHADTNIARRMRLLKGRVDSAVDVLAGYHCGHTRQATPLHVQGRTANDIGRFVERVDSPFVQSQASAWGSPDVEVEEIDLKSPKPYFQALEKSIINAADQQYKAVYNNSSYRDVAYATDHVLPHICDVLHNLPPGKTILYFGDDDGLLSGLRAFLEHAGRTPRFILIDHPHLPDIDAAGGGLRRPLDQALAEFDVAVIQLPSAHRGSPAERDRWDLWCRRVLDAIAAHERQAPAARRRRVIVVNAVHNGIEPHVASTLAPAAMPFSTRLRQGFVVDRRQPHAGADLDGEDRDLLCEAIVGILCGEPMAGWERLAPEILTIVNSAEQRQGFGLSAQSAARLRGRAKAEIRHAVARLVEGPVRLDARAQVANRLCCPADWSDPDWNAMAQAYFGTDAVRFRSRSPWIWERVSLAVNLRATLEQTMMFPTRTPRVLVVSAGPDYMVVPLSWDGYEVAYATTDEILGRADHSEAWRQTAANMRAGRPYRPSRQRSVGAAGQFEAVIILNLDWAASPGGDADRVLALIARDVAPHGLLLAPLTVQIGAVDQTEGVTFAQWRALFHAEGVLGGRGFRPMGECDHRIPLDTALRAGRPAGGPGPIPSLSLQGEAGGLAASAVLTARWPRTLKPGRPPAPRDRRADEGVIYARLGRDRPFSWSHRQRIEAAVAGLSRSHPPPGWERYALEIAAVAASPGALRTAFGLSGRSAAGILRKAEAAAGAALAGLAATPVRTGERTAIATRLCSGMDWDNRDWAGLASRLAGAPADGESPENVSTWQELALLWSLRSSQAERSKAPVLVVGEASGRLLQMLTELGVRSLHVAEPPAADGVLIGSGYEHMVLAAGILERGPEPLDAIFAALEPLAAPRCTLHAAVCVELSAGRSEGALPFGQWRTLYDADGVLGARGFQPRGRVSAHIPLDTALRCGDLPDREDCLAWRDGPGVFTSAVTTARWPDRLSPGLPYQPNELTMAWSPAAAASDSRPVGSTSRARARVDFIDACFPDD